MKSKEEQEDWVEDTWDNWTRRALHPDFPPIEFDSH